MSKNKYDALGTRMKGYESVSRNFLTRRVPAIIRIDGKAFHTFTRGMEKPFDKRLMEAMQGTMQFLCKNIQGCVFGYTQSDEITLVLTDYASSLLLRGLTIMSRRCAVSLLLWQRWSSTEELGNILNWRRSSIWLCSMRGPSLFRRRRYAIALFGGRRMPHVTASSRLGRLTSPTKSFSGRHAMRYRRCCGRREISTGTTFLLSVSAVCAAITSPGPRLCRIRETLGTPSRLSAGSGSLTKSRLSSRRIGSTLRSGFNRRNVEFVPIYL